jgi:DedD protein
MVRNADSIQGLQPSPVPPASIQEPNFYIGNTEVQPPAGLDAAPAERTGENPETLTISVPRPNSAAVPTGAAPVNTPAAPKPAAGGSAGRPAATQARPAPPAPPARPAAAPAARPAPASRPIAPAKPKTRQDYWVQTGAFSAKVRAEGAKETLADKGITSIIDDREVDGKTWYRVRVGPYTSETEARYWLALVQSIDGFDGSQVRSDPR